MDVTDTDQPGTPSAAVDPAEPDDSAEPHESAEAIEAADAIDAGPDTSFEDQERAVGIDPDARLPGEEGLRIILFGAIALFGIRPCSAGASRPATRSSGSSSPSRSARSACCSRGRGAGDPAQPAVRPGRGRGAGLRVEVVFEAIDSASRRIG